MCCVSEEQMIRNRLKNVAGIERLDFNVMQREVTVSYALEDDGSILSALQSLGLGARRKLDAPVVEDEKSSRAAWVGMGVAGAAALACQGVAWTSGSDNSWPVIVLSLLSMAAGGRETLRKGWVALKALTLNINFLMSLAVAGAILIGQWPEAAMVTFLFGVAELVENYSLGRARNAIQSLLQMTPETASVQLETGAWREVRADEVRIGQIVRVRPGERIPLDGTLTTGASSVNQAPITGESWPVEKSRGDDVFAGTINERGAFEFRVTAGAGQTTLARIIIAVQEAQAQRAPTQRFIDNFARFYTPAVVLLALGVAVVPPLFFGAEFSLWFYRALVLLVISCPCALVISTPVTVVSGLAAAARLGILVKGGVHLESGRRLKMVALDKTGTLTQGQPVVTEVVPLNGQTRDETLQLAASLDAPSEHPVAAALVAAWTQSPAQTALISLGGALQNGQLLFVSGFEALPGRGATGLIGGARYFVGNRRLAQENGVCDGPVEAALERLENEGATAVILSDETAALAVFGVADALRESSIEAVRELHELGIQSVMLSGDNAPTARSIARKVGIDDARGELLPADKLAAIDELLEKYGAVGMVGDGINDAPALAKSTIGFAMGAAGADTAIETADVALMQDDLRKLPQFVRLSRATGRVLAQNIAFAIAIKIIFFALALGGHVTLWMAVFADMGGSLIVVFNGLRLLRFGK